MGKLAARTIFSNDTGPLAGTGLDTLAKNQGAILELEGAQAPQSKTITDGSISPTAAYVIVDTEGSAAADDLDVINPVLSASENLHDGMIVHLKAADSGRVVTVKNSGSANGINTYDGNNYVLSTTHWLKLQLRSGKWYEIEGRAMKTALAAATAAAAASTPATTTSRGIGRVAVVADDVTVVNGPAFMAAGTAGALKQSVRADYLTSGNLNLLDPGTFICDNTAGGIINAPTNFNPVFVYTKEWVLSGASYILYEEARSFEGPVQVMHRTFVPVRGTWSVWEDKMFIPAYSKVNRATSAIGGRLSMQSPTGQDNVTLWPNAGKLMVSRNTGDATVENEYMILDPVTGTINGVLPAPRPTASNFVVCGATLPAGGTWAYCVNCWNGTGYYIQTYSGVAAGGTTVAGGANYFSGFAWRVA